MPPGPRGAFPGKKRRPSDRIDGVLRTSTSIAVLSTSLAVIATGAEKVTYDDHVLPVFQQSCLNCHNPDKAKGGLDLSTYSGAMKGGSGGKIAEPGDAGSKLIAVVTHAAEPVMPPEGDKLGNDQIQLLKAWIEGGLLENKSSSARKPTKPKFDASLKSSADEKPEGPPPMPAHVLLDPPVTAARASAVHAIAASPWAPLLAVTGQKQVLLFHTGTLELAGILPFPEGDPVSLAFTPNARYLIVGGGVPGKSGVTVTFDVVTGERMLVAAKEFDSVLAADLKPDLSLVATGSPSRLIKAWKAEDGSQVHSIKKHTDWVTALDFSPDGILLATGDRNGGVWVWEADSGNEFHTLRAHQAGITAAVFRADSNLLATTSEDGTVRFWEMNGGSEVRKLDAHPGGVLAFGWARDGSFATAGRDRAVRLWKPDFNLLREFKEQPDLPVAVAIDHEGKRLFAADYRGQISAWDIESGNPAGGFDANPPSVEQRLAALREEIRKHPEALAAAEAAAAAARQKLAEIRTHSAEAEAAVGAGRQALEAAAKGKQEKEQRLAALNQQLPAKRDQAAQAQGRLDAAVKDSAAKVAAIAALDQRIATSSQEHQAAAAELKRLEEELAKARAENRSDAIGGLEAALGSQRPKVDAAAAALEQVRSERAREQALLTEAETRQQAAVAETMQLNAELAALDKEAGELPAAVAAAGKTLADAEATLKAREAAVGPARDAVAPAEKASQEADAALERQKQQLPALQQRERHWTAAGINADALRTRALVEQKDLESEGLVAEFQELVTTLDEQTAALATARQNLAALEASPPADGAAQAVEAARAQVAALESQHAESSAALAGAKEKLDAALPEIHALRAKAEDLTSRYQALLPPP
jgi:hypothetical protein